MATCKLSDSTAISAEFFTTLWVVLQFVVHVPQKLYLHISSGRQNMVAIYRTMRYPSVFTTHINLNSSYFY